MEKENKEMTEWLKLERLEMNNLPLPQYETEHSAGVDFAACLTRPCKHIPSGMTHKQAESFICCEPTLDAAYSGGDLYSGQNSEAIARQSRIIKRHRVGETWQEIRQTDKPQLVIFPEETVMIPLGFKCEFGSSYVLNLHVRSSIGLSGIMLANGTGIIDPDYRGELFIVAYNRHNMMPIIIEHGQRIAQGVMLQFNQAIITEGAVDTTKRGTGGFGSTNRPETELTTMTEKSPKQDGCCQDNPVDPADLASPNEAELAEATQGQGCCQDEVELEVVPANDEDQGPGPDVTRPAIHSTDAELAKKDEPASEKEACPPSG